jgi:hypothetical protein
MKQSKSKIKGIIEAKKKTNGLTAIFVIRKGNAEIIALSNKKNQSQEMYDVYNNSKHTNIVDIRKEISRKFGTPIPKPFPKGTRKNENEKRAKQSVRG